MNFDKIYQRVDLRVALRCHSWGNVEIDDISNWESEVGFDQSTVDGQGMGQSYPKHPSDDENWGWDVHCLEEGVSWLNTFEIAER